MKCTFTQVSENQRCYDSEISYTEFKGFIIKMIAKLLPEICKKQVQTWLNEFKAFVEKQ